MTKTVSKSLDSNIELTRCEAEVMEVVWQRGRSTVSEILDSIQRELAYTTVQTTVNILESKGVLHRGEKVGRAYSYDAAVTRERVQSTMLKSLVYQLFGGSFRSLGLSLLESDEVSEDDIAALRQAADRLGEA